MTTVHLPDALDLPDPLLAEHVGCRHCQRGRHCVERAAEFRNYARLMADRVRRLREEVAQLHVEARLLPLERRTPHPVTRRGWAVRAGDPF
jgi:hypothetical protein